MDAIWFVWELCKAIAVWIAALIAAVLVVYGFMQFLANRRIERSAHFSDTPKPYDWSKVNQPTDTMELPVLNIDAETAEYQVRWLS